MQGRQNKRIKMQSQSTNPDGARDAVVRALPEEVVFPELPGDFQGMVFKDRMKERCYGICDQFVDILLIDW